MKRHRCHGGICTPLREDGARFWVPSTGPLEHRTLQTWLPEDTIRVIMGCPTNNGRMNDRRVVICNSHPKASNMYARHQSRLIGQAETGDEITATCGGHHLCAVIPTGLLIFMPLKYLKPAQQMPDDWRFQTWPKGSALACGVFGDNGRFVL